MEDVLVVQQQGIEFQHSPRYNNSRMNSNTELVLVVQQVPGPEVDRGRKSLETTTATATGNSPSQESQLDRSSDHSVLYIGDVNESESYTYKLRDSMHKKTTTTAVESSTDIAFIPPMINIDKESWYTTTTENDYQEQLTVAVPIPRDGTFVGDPKLVLLFSKSTITTPHTQADIDISFVPLEKEVGERNGGNVQQQQEEGSPSTDPNGEVPNYGGFVVARLQKGQFMSSINNNNNDRRDIDFSPAGSALETAAPPREGSFSEDRNATPKRNVSSRHGIHISPDKDVPWDPPPAIQDSLTNSSPWNERQSGMDCLSKSMLLVVGLGTSHAVVVDREINFSPGVSEMETAPPPLNGSYQELALVLRHSSPAREAIATGVDKPISPPPREINFSPGASDMETGAPPVQGSFLESCHSILALGSSSSMQEINVLPHTAGKDMQTSPPPNQGTFVRLKTVEEQPQSPTTHLTNGNEVDSASKEVDSDDDEPMQNDQILWRSKKLWEAAKIKQSAKIDGVVRDATGQTIICGEPNDSNGSADQLRFSIHKLGALCGSASNESSAVPQNSPEETDGFGDSILKNGELLGSTHIDNSLVQTKDMEAGVSSEAGDNKLDEGPDAAQVVENMDSDLLLVTELLGGEKPVVSDDENSVSESMAEIRPLVEVSSRPQSKVNHDDETVQIANTTKLRQVRGNEIKSDEYVPDGSIANLEALLDEALQAPLELSIGKPCVSPSNFIDYGRTLAGEVERQITDNLTSKSLTLDVPEVIEGLMLISNEELYILEESIAKLEALLEEALEAPLEPVGNESLKDDALLNDSRSDFDDLFEEALEDELEITFEPTEEETKAMMKVDTTTSDARSKPMSKPISSTSRITRLTQSSKAKTKSKFVAEPSQKQSQASTSRTRVIPRFRGLKTASRGEKLEIPELPSGPRLLGSKSISNAGKGKSFLSTNFSVGKKRAAVTGNGSTEASKTGVARTTNKLISKLTVWTKRGNENDVSRNQSSVPAAAKPKQVMKTPAKQLGHRFTGMNSIPTSGRPGLHELTPMAHSVVSLSSQCSVTDFKSPRREGKPGCQQKYNPYLHDHRGLCELCVFFLSDEDKAKLDAEGRHYRVMFTSGGCCKTCQIFPRIVEEYPARLCRMCYGNSHRLLT